MAFDFEKPHNTTAPDEAIRIQSACEAHSNSIYIRSSFTKVGFFVVWKQTRRHLKCCEKCPYMRLIFLAF